MENPRAYGMPPFQSVLVHGGPGAAGELAPVARIISATSGVLEPLQTARTVFGQVEELKSQIERHAGPPVTLVGYSWGAWLSLLCASRHPGVVRKLIMVSSGPFLDRYVPLIQEARFSRLSASEKKQFATISAVIDRRIEGDPQKAFQRLGELFTRTDAFDPVPDETVEVVHDPVIYRNVWAEAAAMRASGELLQLGGRVKCPVVAFHGDHDPHPAEGVKEPLSGVLKNFRFVLLKDCGHRPWAERRAREEFLIALKAELGMGSVGPDAGKIGVP